jgi:hypothetical protein
MEVTLDPSQLMPEYEQTLVPVQSDGFEAPKFSASLVITAASSARERVMVVRKRMRKMSVGRKWRF